VKEHLFSYEWNLSNGFPAKDIKYNDRKVFSCFAGGGGSSMGYKLAGYNVIGMNEIDEKMAACYINNLNPKYYYIEKIQDFKYRNDLPKELYNLDILDGSPPCSSFSIAGNREKDWGKTKKFREGQSEQILDTLFFDFIELGNKLQPKVIIAENVKGLLLGNAKKYVRKIYEAFENAGYYCQHWLLDASKMGVPQKRERVFFICLRKDLAKQFLIKKGLLLEIPKLELYFNEKEIVLDDIIENDFLELKNSQKYSYSRYGDVLCDKRKVLSTIATINRYFIDVNHFLSTKTLLLASTFCLDYNFLKQKAIYIIGMSVPPVMIAQIANQIRIQWFNKMEDK